MEVDWDLHAVVRACCSTASSTAPTTVTATATTTAGAASSSLLNCYNNERFLSSGNGNFMGFFQDPFLTRNDNSIERFLNDLNNPLEFPKLQKLPQGSQSVPISPLSVIGGLQDPPMNHHHQHHHHQYQQHHQQNQKQLQGKQQAFGITRCTTSNAQSTRSKKRKNQMKRVCQVPAEGLSSDVWSWRKYGQKPIKGSPYPRGYYRCSTSKGCLARKQVERNRSDPDMFIITYTGDHSHPVPTHRNSLAGSTRTKPTTSGEEDPIKQPKPTSSPPEYQSLATEKTEDNDNDNDNDNDTDEDNFDMVMEDDFFEGLEEIVGPVTSAGPPSFPWLTTKVTTAAGGS